MNEKPIIFSTEMVQAILDGRKTQTRRVVKKKYSNTVFDWYHNKKYGDPVFCEAEPETPPERLADGRTCHKVRFFEECTPPYQPGNLLWVRETWARIDCRNCDGNHPVYIQCDTEPNDVDGCYFYKADGTVLSGDAHWCPSIHMPRAAARIFLRVTDVRVERLRDISHLDCLAEGIRIHDDDAAEILHELDLAVREKRIAPGTAADAGHLVLINLYRKLWDSLNAKRGYGWDSNPWVWVISFDRVEAPR